MEITANEKIEESIKYFNKIKKLALKHIVINVISAIIFFIIFVLSLKLYPEMLMYFTIVAISLLVLVNVIIDLMAGYYTYKISGKTIHFFYGLLSFNLGMPYNVMKARKLLNEIANKFSEPELFPWSTIEEDILLLKQIKEIFRKKRL